MSGDGKNDTSLGTTDNAIAEGDFSTKIVVVPETELTQIQKQWGDKFEKVAREKYPAPDVMANTDHKDRLKIKVSTSQSIER